jgi:diaminopimelate epimerase
MSEWEVPEQGTGVQAIHVMDRDPSFEKDGILYIPDDFDAWYEIVGGWRQPDNCDHAESMCGNCIWSWNEDHIVVLTIEGHNFNLDELNHG